jgi:FixJ family two-component response regulator
MYHTYARIRLRYPLAMVRSHHPAYPNLANREAGLPKHPLISIVDDDESVREGLSDLFKAMGFAVAAFPRAFDFLNSKYFSDTTCLIADVQMPEMTGIALCNHLLKLGNRIPTILITAYPDDNDRARATEAGVIGYLVKPYDHDELLACVRSTMEPDQAEGRQSC